MPLENYNAKLLFLISALLLTQGVLIGKALSGDKCSIQKPLDENLGLSDDDFEGFRDRGGLGSPDDRSNLFSAHPTRKLLGRAAEDIREAKEEQVSDPTVTVPKVSDLEISLDGKIDDCLKYHIELKNMRISFVRGDLAGEQSFGQDISPADAFEKIFEINQLHNELRDETTRSQFEKESLGGAKIKDIKSRFTRSKELLKKLRGLIGSEPIDLQCGQKVSIPQPPRGQSETPAFLSFEDGIEINLENGQQLKLSVFVEADIDPEKSFIECINRCCPAATPPAPSPQEEDQISPTPAPQDQPAGPTTPAPAPSDSEQKCSFPDVIVLPEFKVSTPPPPKRSNPLEGMKGLEEFGVTQDILSELLNRRSQELPAEISHSGGLNECLEFELNMKNFQFDFKKDDEFGILTGDGTHKVGSRGLVERLGVDDMAIGTRIIVDFAPATAKKNLKIVKLFNDNIVFDVGKKGELQCGQTQVLREVKRRIITEFSLIGSLTEEAQARLRGEIRRFKLSITVFADIKLTLRCRSECCPAPATVAPTPTPQDQPVTPTPEGTSDAGPTEEEIGTGGGAGGASGQIESNVTSSSDPARFREQKEAAFRLAPGSITVNDVSVSQSEKTKGFVVTFTSSSRPRFDNNLFISVQGEDSLTPGAGVQTTSLTRGGTDIYFKEPDGSLSYRLSTAGSFGIFADVFVKRVGQTVTVNFTINDIERGSDRIRAFLFHMQDADGSVSGAHFFNNPFTGFRFVSP